jgi:immunoglobulin heavy chain
MVRVPYVAHVSTQGFLAGEGHVWFSSSLGFLSQVQLQETWPDLLCHLCSLWILHHIQWLVLTLDPSAPGKGLDRMRYKCYQSSTGCSPYLKSYISISRDTSKNQLSLQLRSVTTEDTALYCCSKHSEGTSVWAQTQASMHGHSPFTTRGGINGHTEFKAKHCSGSCEMPECSILRMCLLPDSFSLEATMQSICGEAPVSEHQICFSSCWQTLS